MQTTTSIINWQSKDFWFTLLMLIGSAFGLTADGGAQIAGVIVGIIGVVGIVRDFLKGAKFVGFRAWLADTNTWAYIAATVTLIVPQAAPLVPGLQELADALLSGNFSKIVVAGLSLLTLAYNIFFRKRAA